MNGMLGDVKVLDLTTNVAGPHAAAILTDYGAEVIKIEIPGCGDDNRTFPALFPDGKSIVGAWVNRGKKSVTLDLKKPKSIEIIKRMIPDMNVIMESYRPGVMDKFGLGYEAVKQLNPSIVYCSLSAFGQSGPYAKKAGYDVLAQAMSGMMYFTGDQDSPPMKHGTALADYFGGFNAYSAIVTALYAQKAFGVGQHIDVNLLQSMIYLNSILDFGANTGKWPAKTGNQHSQLCPFGSFAGNNGETIILGAPSPKMWTALCEAMGRPELSNDERFDTVGKRVKIRDEVTQIIEAWLKSLPSVNEAIDALNKVGVPCCKVFSGDDVINDPHVRQQEFIVEAPTPDDYTQRTFLTRNCSAKFSELPGSIHKAPTVGQHNHEILERYGLTSEEVDELEASFVKER